MKIWEAGVRSIFAHREKRIFGSDPAAHTLAPWEGVVGFGKLTAIVANELLIVGSVALDSVKTPFGEVKEALGGSATYSSYSASFFTDVRLVGVVGEDFPQEHIGLERAWDSYGRASFCWGKTFLLGRRL